MIDVKCPSCQSSSLTDLEDCTIYPEEIQQDFACDDCETKFAVTYAPIAIKPLPEET